MVITNANVADMARLVTRHGILMREAFNMARTDTAHWFPGHMAKGLKQMQTKLKSVDCVIEVHDARIPVSGRNPQFEKRLGTNSLKPHLLILNKMDLIDMRNKNRIMRYYADQGIQNIIFTNCKNPDSKGIKSIIPKVSELIRKSERFNRSEETSYQLMVIGIPNVGKSSLINALRAKHLRRSKATPVGNVPGITQSVLERIKVSEMFILIVGYSQSVEDFSSLPIHSLMIKYPYCTLTFPFFTLLVYKGKMKLSGKSQCSLLQYSNANYFADIQILLGLVYSFFPNDDDGG